MNPKPMSETEAIRSDIEMTRRRMDETVDALGERMHGRHLLDEVIGLFRHSGDEDSATHKTAARVREKVSEAAGKISATAGNAASAAVDTVKKNPLPFVLIAGGAAWLAYSVSRGRTANLEEDEMDEENHYDPETHYDRPIEYPAAGMSSENDMPDEEEGSKFDEMKGAVKDKAAAAREKLSDLSGKARDKLQSVKERASEFGSRIKDRASDLGGQVQDRVAQTVDDHPLEIGLGCLALGIVVGLALPTPGPVNRVAGPTVDRLRNRTRDAGREMLQKGKRVVQAASDAAKHEAESQGLTMDRLHHPSDSGQAAGGTQEGMMSASSGEPRAGAEPADPSAARPAM